MTGFSDLLVEVYVEANEPWHDGLRNAYAEAVREFCEIDSAVPTEDIDYDAALTGAIEAYQGWGTNAHEDADGPVFRGAEAAQHFTDILRRHIGPLATVKQHTLS